MIPHYPPWHEGPHGVGHILDAKFWIWASYAIDDRELNFPRMRTCRPVVTPQNLPGQWE